MTIGGTGADRRHGSHLRRRAGNVVHRNTGVKITAVAPPAANGTAAVAVVVTVGGVQSTPSSPGVNIYTYTWPTRRPSPASGSPQGPPPSRWARR